MGISDERRRKNMKWITCFQYLPIHYGITLGELSNIRQIVLFENNLEGDYLRILLSNKYGKKALVLDRVTIGREDDGEIIEKKDVTVHDKQKIVIKGGEEFYSDTIRMKVKAKERLALSIDIIETQEIQSLCGYFAKGLTEVRIQKLGLYQSQTMEETYQFVREDPSNIKGEFFFGFSAVQVYTDDGVKVVTAFGDSITAMSFYTNALMKRLYEKYPAQVTLLNAGIGGNRLLHDATWIREAIKEGQLFGDAGVRRFEKDVFERDQVDCVVCLMGINDIMHPILFEKAKETISTAYLIEGLTYLAHKAHEHGAKIYCATIMPCGHHDYANQCLQTIEKTRNEVNKWVREQDLFDGYFDFDEVLKDENNPGYLREDVHIGDGLHPNVLGGRILAECVDLRKIVE